VIEAKVAAKARHGADKKMKIQVRPVGKGLGWGSRTFIRGNDDLDTFTHGSPNDFVFRLKTRISKLENQCVALRAFYAGKFMMLQRYISVFFDFFCRFQNHDCLSLTRLRVCTFVYIHILRVCYMHGYTL
jgi:hypothetical protein